VRPVTFLSVIYTTDAHGRVMGNLALAGGREDPQRHHHHHQAEQIVRRASQPARAQRWPPLGNIFGTSIEEVRFA